SERAFAQAAARNLLPLRGLHRLIHPRRLSREAEHVSEDRIGDGFGERVRRVADANAKLRGRVTVDRINARAPLADHPQASGLKKDLSSEPIVATDRAVDVA